MRFCLHYLGCCPGIQQICLLPAIGKLGRKTTQCTDQPASVCRLTLAVAGHNSNGRFRFFGPRLACWDSDSINVLRFYRPNDSVEIDSRGEGATLFDGAIRKNGRNTLSRFAHTQMEGTGRFRAKSGIRRLFRCASRP